MKRSFLRKLALNGPARDPVLLSGNGNRALAEEIAQLMGIQLCTAKVKKFGDGETRVHIEQTVRGRDVFVIQPTCSPVNDHLMELLLINDALKRASAKSITDVIPYFGYARQDRKHIGRVPISAKLTANLITVSGANRVLTLDLHAGQIQGFFDIPTDVLRSDEVYKKRFIEFRGDPKYAISTADAGGIKRARILAEALELALVVVEKRRLPGIELTETMNVIGEPEGRQIFALGRFNFNWWNAHWCLQCID